MDTNHIIDAELADNKQLLSPKALAILNTTGFLSMALGGIGILQIMFGLAQTLRSIMDFTSYMDMGGMHYYILSGMFNRLVNMMLTGFAVVFFFRYAIFASKGDKTSFGKKEWETVFENIRNLLVVFGLKNIFWFLFSLLNIFIGIII